MNSAKFVRHFWKLAKFVRPQKMVVRCKHYRITCSLVSPCFVTDYVCNWLFTLFCNWLIAMFVADCLPCFVTDWLLVSGSPGAPINPVVVETLASLAYTHPHQVVPFLKVAKNVYEFMPCIPIYDLFSNSLPQIPPFMLSGFLVRHATHTHTHVSYRCLLGLYFYLSLSFVDMSYRPSITYQSMSFNLLSIFYSERQFCRQPRTSWSRPRLRT